MMSGLPAQHPLAIVSQKQPDERGPLYALNTKRRKQEKGRRKTKAPSPYLIIDGEGAYYQKLIKATLLVAWGLQNQ